MIDARMYRLLSKDMAASSPRNWVAVSTERESERKWLDACTNHQTTWANLLK